MEHGVQIVVRCKVLVLLVLLSLSVTGCGPTRTLYSFQMSENGRVPQIEDARVWADDQEAIFKALRTSPITKRSKSFNVLALSGGGSEGAFGAGFLTGWSKNGGRPQFDIVTGTSVGALIAPFAFLGEEYDPYLERMFTKEQTNKLIRIAGLDALFGSAVFSNRPLAKMVDRYIDDDLLAQIATEHNKGRLLLVLTTNIDTQRTAIWNMGAIAASDHKDKKALFHQVLLASVSVPGLLPPQLIEVQSGNTKFKEMHVDGGVSGNAMLIPEAMLASSVSPKLRTKPRLYLLMNGKIDREFRLVAPSTIEILERSFGTAIKISTRNTIRSSAQFARANGWQILVAALDASYPVPKQEGGLKQEVLRPLFAKGVQNGQGGRGWKELDF